MSSLQTLLRQKCGRCEADQGGCRAAAGSGTSLQAESLPGGLSTAARQKHTALQHRVAPLWWKLAISAAWASTAALFHCNRRDFTFQSHVKHKPHTVAQRRQHWGDNPLLTVLTSLLAPNSGKSSTNLNYDANICTFNNRDMTLMQVLNKLCQLTLISDELFIYS